MGVAVLIFEPHLPNFDFFFHFSTDFRFSKISVGVFRPFLQLSLNNVTDNHFFQDSCWPSMMPCFHPPRSKRTLVTNCANAFLEFSTKFGLWLLFRHFKFLIVINIIYIFLFRLVACVKSFPSPPLWKTLREMCMNWRHRSGLIDQWNRVNLSLLSR